jgi:hypothetical protein
MQQSAARSQAAAQYANDIEAAKMQRSWNRYDVDEARAYDAIQMAEQREYSRQYLGNLVQDAEKAGFNPLSILRAGGGGNYNAAAGLAPLSSPTVAPTQAPARQAVGGSPFGAALQSVGDFIRDFDPYADSRREKEYALIDAQIRNLDGQTREMRLSGEFDRRPKTAVLSKKAAEDNRQPIWTEWRDRDGKSHWFPNPDLPDLDQMAVPSAGIVFSEATEAVKSATGALSAPGWLPNAAPRKRHGRNPAIR